jgi:hypothetical protein
MPLHRQVHLRILDQSLQQWKERAKKEGRPLAEYVSRRVNAGAPTWEAAKAALLTALPPDAPGYMSWATWLESNVRPLWNPVHELSIAQWLASPVGVGRNGMDVAESERKAANARYAKRWRYLRDWKEWGDSPQAAFLGVVQTAEKRGAKMPAGWRERAQAIRDAAPPDWGKQYLALFPDLA